ncbi:hypothetical protein FNX48_008870 [Streptomyces sp. IF17]|nr:hypothetical protein [Streptomyces alkaliphilus]
MPSISPEPSISDGAPYGVEAPYGVAPPYGTDPVPASGGVDPAGAGPLSSHPFPDLPDFPGAGGPVGPEAPAGDGAGMSAGPVQHPGHPAAGAALPPNAPPPPGDDAATQYLPPVPAGDDAAATQYLPPVPAGDDAAATQYLPPVPAGDDAAATQYLPPVAPARDLPPATAAPDDATRWIEPVRDTVGGAPEGNDPFGDAGATRVLPPIPAGPVSGKRAAARRAALPAPGGRAAARRAARRPGPFGSGLSPRALAVVVLAGCAVAGLTAGAVFGGGDRAAAGDGAPPGIPGPDVDPLAGDPDPVGGAEPEPEPEPEPDPGPDPAAVAARAEALSELLEESAGSREAVVAAVGRIEECKKLKEAAETLRGAAGERTSQVMRLHGMSLDGLPEHRELSRALTEAWEASADADDRYADWALEVREDRRRMCRRGETRRTDNTAEAERAGAEATAAKERAAELWNPIAREYGLPERTAGDL